MKTDIEKELIEADTELLMYAKFLTKDLFRAYDLLQETNMKVLIQRDKFREEKCFRAWAKRIMLNSFINNTNRESRIEAVDSYTGIYWEDMNLPIRSDNMSETKDIYRALDKLPDGNGKIMRLLIAGHKYHEIAMMLHIPLGTVKSKIFVSRGILKKELKDYI